MGETNPKRIRRLNTAGISSGPVLYWMSRDQRVEDNWALLFSISQAKLLEQPVAVVFCLVPNFLNAQPLHYGFMIKNLKAVEGELRKANINFYLVAGHPEVEIPALAKKLKAGLVVSDFSPLRIARSWKEKVAEALPVAMMEIDAHNIIPAWIASPKQEFGAHTFRPKVHRLLEEFLVEFPRIRPVSKSNQLKPVVNIWPKNLPTSTQSGSKAGSAVLEDFLHSRLAGYDNKRNDPNQKAQSGLSVYLHFGQLAAQRAALKVLKLRQSKNTEAFLEELIVRRELAENFCFYNTHYDSFEGFPAWAQKTLNKHRHDKREFVYSQSEFEAAKTHDDLWNAAQIEMVKTGKMHGYMRMYWAKKILEWSKDPETAMDIAIYLNDKYELDGRDPNGYAGIAWSIGGVHDRAWGERPIFGKIRYMSYNGCKSKFDVPAYIESTNSLK